MAVKVLGVIIGATTDHIRRYWVLEGGLKGGGGISFGLDTAKIEVALQLTQWHFFNQQSI